MNAQQVREILNNKADHLSDDQLNKLAQIMRVFAEACYIKIQSDDNHFLIKRTDEEKSSSTN